MGEYKWLLFGVCGAGFAAVVNVMSKKALDAADVFVALSLQSLLMFTTLLVSVTIMGRWGHAREIPRWALGMIVLSGIAGGLSWTFGYQALQLSNVAKAGTVDKLSVVFAILLAIAFLKERPSPLNWVGIVLVLAGVYCVAHSSKKPEGKPGTAEHRPESGDKHAEAEPAERPGLTAIGPGPASAPDEKVAAVVQPTTDPARA